MPSGRCTAGAAPTITRNFECPTVPPATARNEGLVELYQSLTPGLDGRLAELHLPIGCESGEVVLEVFDAGADGLPATGATPRLRRSYAADLFPSVVTVDFQTLPLGGRVGVTAGEYIVFVLSNPTGSCGVAAGMPGDTYLGGTVMGTTPRIRMDPFR